MAVGFPTKANWAAGDVLTASAMDDLAGTVNTVQYLKPWNQVLNSNMSVWQRGTSISLAASTSAANGYTADRWQTATSANQAITVSRQSTADTTNLPNIQYCLRYQRNSGQTGTTALAIAQSFETINSIPFVGKAVTISFYARAGSNFSASGNTLNAYLYSGTTTDGNINTSWAGLATVASTSATLTTTWQRFTATGTVSASAMQLAPYFSFTPTGTAGTNDYYEITGVQVELGSTANTYQPNGATYAAELAACQRYLPAVIGGSEAYVGYAYATNSVIYSLTLPTQARVLPTGMTLSSGFTCVGYGLNVSYAISNLTFNGSTQNAFTVYSSSGVTIVAGQGSRLGLTGTILLTGCEL
jgi:hypothetical protein